MSALLPVFELSFIFTSVLKLFLALPMLQVVSPVSFIALSIGVDVSSEPVGSVIMKLAGIDVAVRMVEHSLTFSQAVLPESIVLCPVVPDLDALAMLDELKSASFADIRRLGLLHLS